MWILALATACSGPPADDTAAPLPVDTDPEPIHDGSWVAMDARPLAHGPGAALVWLTALNLGDIDADGYEDLLVGNYDGSFTRTLYDVWYGPLFGEPRVEPFGVVGEACTPALWLDGTLFTLGSSLTRLRQGEVPTVVDTRASVRQIVPVGDWDGDGAAEIAVVLDTRVVVVRTDFERGDDVLAEALGTILGGGQRVAWDDGRLYVTDATDGLRVVDTPFSGAGMPVRIGAAPSSLGNQMALADVDADGDRDVLAAGWDGWIYAFDRDGHELRRLEVSRYWESARIFSGRFDEDQVEDVNFGEEVFSGPFAGPEWPIGRLSSVDALYVQFAAWIDADGDGDQEPVVAVIDPAGGWIGILDP